MVFVPDNELERSLIKATEHPSHQLQFYRELLASDIHVVQQGPAMATTGKVKRKKGRQVRLQYIEVDGEVFLPFFSSMPRLQAAIDDRAKCLTLNAADFLQMTRGAQLLLNPGSPVGKAFTPEEVAALLDGSIFQDP